MRSILDVAKEAGVNYWEDGEVYRAYCCFHYDKKTPNLTFFPRTNSFYCFACGAAYSELDFLCLFYKISRSEAVTKYFGEEYLKKALLGENNTAIQEPFFQLLFSISETCRPLFQKFHRENRTEKINELIHILKKVDSEPLSLLNLETTLEDISGVANVRGIEGH